MHPAYWPSSRDEGVLLTGLYHTSVGFYVRTTDPTEENPIPEAKIGYMTNLAFDQRGEGDIATGFNPDALWGRRVRSDPKIIDGKFYISVLERPTGTGIYRRAYGVPPAGVSEELFLYPNSSTYAQTAFQGSRKAVVGEAGGSLIFIRTSDDQRWSFGKDAEGAFPGSASASYNTRANNLYFNARAGSNFTYGKIIANDNRVFGFGAGGDLSRVIGFAGEDGETPLWISEGGDAPIGTCLSSWPVAVLGNTVYGIQVWGERVYRPDSSSIFQTSIRVYELVINDGGLTRSLAASIINGWELREGTGPGTNNSPIYDRIEESASGSYMVAAMRTKEDGDIFERVPHDMTENIGATSIATGLFEINPSLWFKRLRNAVGGISARWQYSRNKGASWTTLDREWTDYQAFSPGAASARRDFRYPSQDRIDLIKAEEQSL